jgi:hypothetical protein
MEESKEKGQIFADGTENWIFCFNNSLSFVKYLPLGNEELFNTLSPEKIN